MSLRALALVFLSITFSVVWAAEQVTQANGQTLQLKGIGVAQELRNDIYIGALYSPTGKESKSELNNPDLAKRMVIRYTIDNYSPRKSNRYWKERIAMNNSRSTWQPMTSDIVKFASLINQNIQPGDEMVIDYIPETGTEVYLNGELFETFKDPTFFKLLLNSWLGSVPPTKAFKLGLQGRLDETTRSRTLERFLVLNPVAGRFKKPAPPEAPTTQPAPEVAAKPVTQPAPKQVPKPAPQKQTAKAEPPKPKPQPPKQAAPKPQPKKQVAAVKKPPALKPIVAEELVIDTDLIRGSFTRELIDHVRKNQRYPRKAQAKGEEGDGVAQVTINTSGEVVEAILIEKTGSRELNKGVLKMIRRAAPFPEIPSELSESTYRFEVPFEFNLPK